MKEDEMKKVIAKNLEKLLKEHNLSNRQLATIADVSESTVGKWLLQKSSPRMGAIQKIADHFNLPKSYILSEDIPQYPVSNLNGGLIIREEPAEYNVRNIYETSNKTIQVPVLGKIACGDPIFAEQNIAEYRTELADNVPPGKIAIVLAHGDSMEPTIPHGAAVMVRDQPDVESGEIAAVLVNGNTEATLKRVRKQGSSIMLVPDNPKYDTIFVNEDYPARIIGKAIKFTFDL